MTCQMSNTHLLLIKSGVIHICKKKDSLNFKNIMFNTLLISLKGRLVIAFLVLISSNHLIGQTSKEGPELIPLKEANALRENGMPKEAVTKCDEAISLNPGWGRAHLLRAVCFQDMEEYDKALADSERAVELDRTSAAPLFVRASIKRDLGDFEGTLADVEQGIKLAPDGPGPYKLRGNAKQGLGDLKGALADYTKAIGLAPDYLDAYAARGSVRAELKDYPGATADFNTVIKLAPEDAAGYSGRGYVFMTMEKYGEALKEFTRAAELDPENGQIWAHRAEVKNRTGDAKGALKDYTKAIELEPGEAEAYVSRSGVRKQTNDAEGALADLDKAVELTPEDEETLLERATLRIATGRHGQAIEDCESALKVQPDSTLARFLRGTAHFGLKEFAEGNADFEHLPGKAEEVYDAPVFLWYGLMKLGKKAEAQAALKNYSKAEAKKPVTGKVKKTVQFLTDALSEKSYLATAGNAEVDGLHALLPGQAQFYAGLKHLFASDKAGAKACFEKCRNAKELLSFESQFAAMELGGL